MNCKQGDLAVFIRSDAGNEGRFVTCVRLMTDREREPLRIFPTYGPLWITDVAVRDTDGGQHLRIAPDEFLRPIRDPGGDATDETLIYAGAPNSEVTA